MKTCSKCRVIKPRIAFQSRPDRKCGLSSQCKDCRNKQSLEKRTELKNRAISLLGGGCSVCGYNKCSQALEFHHLDPSQKDFEINGRKVWSKEVEDELNKCILVCSNCHRKIHAKE